jgi:hypothetical protein
VRFHGPAAHGHWLAAICMQWLAAQSLTKGRKKSSIFTYQGHVTLPNVLPIAKDRVSILDAQQEWGH